jgi:hypothetical protein
MRGRQAEAFSAPGPGAAGSSSVAASGGAGDRKGFIVFRRLEVPGLAGSARKAARSNFGFIENMVMNGAFHRRPVVNA